MVDKVDLIKRQDALKVIESADNGEIPYAIVNDLFKALPSADAVSREFYEDAVKANIRLVIENRKLKEQIESAEAVQGEWIWRTDIPIGGWRTSAGYICSNCGKDYWHGNVFNFCPSCGARMKGGDSE